MATRQFELFMCCLGNGITVCNKAVKEHGDYKIIAHISNGGNIKLYVKESYIPDEAMEEIKKSAAQNASQFRASFEKYSDMQQYEKILDELSYKKYREVVSDQRPLTEKLSELRKYYYSIA